jgi:predicted O-methyltransferase YrrM
MVLTPERARYVVQAARAIVAQPYEGVEQGLERVAGWREARAGVAPYGSTANYEQALHEHVGAAWPCPEGAEFSSLWRTIMSSLHARGLKVGRGTYGGWDDADPGLARSAWCLVRHLRPRTVVETGVGRGLSTRVVLEGLRRNDAGRLISIDMPPLIKRGIVAQLGAAVTPELTDRWTLLSGSSRRCLPSVLDGLGHIDQPVDVFVHDSMHTARNVEFELEHAWPRMADRGVVLVDDVERNEALRTFTSRHGDASVLVCDADDGVAQFGLIVRRPKSPVMEPG